MSDLQRDLVHILTTSPSSTKTHSTPDPTPSSLAVFRIDQLGDGIKSATTNDYKISATTKERTRRKPMEEGGSLPPTDSGSPRTTSGATLRTSAQNSAASPPSSHQSSPSGGGAGGGGLAKRSASALVTSLNPSGKSTADYASQLAARSEEQQRVGATSTSRSTVQPSQQPQLQSKSTSSIRDVNSLGGAPGVDNRPAHAVTRNTSAAATHLERLAVVTNYRKSAAGGGESPARAGHEARASAAVSKPSELNDEYSASKNVGGGGGGGYKYTPLRQSSSSNVNSPLANSSTANSSGGGDDENVSSR